MNKSRYEKKKRKEVKINSFHPGQQKIADTDKRFNVACIGRRWGKTECMTTLAIRELVSGTDRRVGYFAPTYKFMRNVFDNIERILQPWIITCNRSTSQIVLSNGSTIKFWSMQDRNSGRGDAYHLAIIDEAGLDENLVVTLKAAIMPTLLDYMGTLFVVGTPGGVGTAFHELFMEAVASDDWNVFTAPSMDNPYLPANDFEAIKKSNEVIYRQEHLAEWINREGEVILQAKHLQYTDRLKKYGMYVLGIDPAVTSNENSDATGVVLLGYDVDHSEEVHVLEDYSARMTSLELASLVNSIVNDCGDNFGYIFIETNQGGEYLKNALITGGVDGFRVKEVRASIGKHLRLLTVQPFFEAGRIKLACDAPSLKHELLSFTYDGYPKRLGSPDRADALVHGVKGLLDTYRMDEFINKDIRSFMKGKK